MVRKCGIWKMRILELFEKIKDVLLSRVTGDTPVDVNELITDAVNKSNLDDDLKSLFVDLFTYVVDDIGIVSDLYDYISDLINKNVELVDTVEPDDHPLEYFNYYAGRIDSLKAIVEWLNIKLENEGLNEAIGDEDVGIIRAEDLK